ncbi:MAG: hypothetical protein A2286_13860 [Gammaproteobacteria bacterium RIFOXYA12_FULL_61_12]|nr:MAG: hypothetical protein A2514_15315 [Gammaproteobacteria bacterium RIFOXYD12_FULL_61_37]OGT90647.1 MAG: hypothetical protein A2286_13860 [Gammaproteobacteria bacterium RIFOXYA12_FULL_61_12]
MLNIGQTSFEIHVPSLPPEEFEFYSTNLFDVWEGGIISVLLFDDYAISLEVEEGSIKGKGKIAVAASVLYFGIGNYGDFIGGLEAIYNQVTYIGEQLFQAAKSPVGGNSTRATKRTNAGAVSSMRRLFEAVRSGSMSVDEAMYEFEKMLGDELAENTAFVDEMRIQLEKAPAYPEQLSLVQDDWEEGELQELPSTPRSPRPKPKPPREQLRIEIWRESKNDRKQVKFIKGK